jgi:uncharacterized protein
MKRRIDRRGLLAGLLTGPWFARRAVAASEEKPAKRGPTLDIHVHLFGAGDNGSGCRLSKATSEGLAMKYLAGRLHLRKRAATLDQAYVLALAEQIEQSGLDKAVVLAQDAVYDSSGQPDWERTQFYVPNDYLFQVVARNSRRMIPCVSINPQRADALAELDRCGAKGARLLKIHPPTQGVDIADRKYSKFFRRCAELKIRVMVHTGHEHSAPILDVALADPRRLALALDQGCTVIACHCGTGWRKDRPDMLPAFLEMIGKHTDLWGDTAVLGSAGRVRDFQRLLADPAARQRLLHGSDFPFPAMPIAFAGAIGLKKAVALQTVENWIQQDLALKEAMEIGYDSARRAYRLICGESNADAPRPATSSTKEG